MSLVELEPVLKYTGIFTVDEADATEGNVSPVDREPNFTSLV